MGRLDGKAVLITGAARGQGRSHAVTVAREGASVIAIDVDGPVAPTSAAETATAADLAETARLVEAAGGRIVTGIADVRDAEALEAVVRDGVETLGRLDVVVANAGIASYGSVDELTAEQWREMLDINLIGVWNTIRASLPHLRAAGGGSIIAISSVAGLKGIPNLAHYVAAKHGVVGLAKTLALELAPERIRVNTVNPANVATDMIFNQVVYDLLGADLPPERRTPEELLDRYGASNPMSLPWADVEDVSAAVVWLASDESRYVTGTAVPIDAGTCAT